MYKNVMAVLDFLSKNNIEGGEAVRLINSAQKLTDKAVEIRNLAGDGLDADEAREVLTVVKKIVRPRKNANETRGKGKGKKA